jgi:branched-chain amino acid transport system substrate-binding protein
VGAEATLQIGLLFSTTGPYATIGRAMRNGARLAVEEVSADAAFPFTIETVEIDAGGSNSRYAAAAERLLTKEGLVHVVGCYTSSSRKEVLPFFEKYDGLLWYPSHYEGFESSEHVVYTGAAPNQHIVPLAQHMLSNPNRRAFCIGSNYIWAWENNKIMREAALAAKGTVLAERYFPVGETDFAAVIDQILALRPSFVFNTLIGRSAYEFFRAFRREALRRNVDQANEIPIASCSLSEPELIEIGPEACDGHVSSSVYFESIDSPRNHSFASAYRRRFPRSGPTSADAESSYLAVHLLARAVRAAQSSKMSATRAAVADVTLDAPQGEVQVDRRNRHCFLTPRIGVSNKAGGFDIIYESPGPIAPDPYLVEETMVPKTMTPPPLRLVR